MQLPVLIQCEHWDTGACKLGLFGGKPSAGVCRGCQHYKGETPNPDYVAPPPPAPATTPRLAPKPLSSPARRRVSANVRTCLACPHQRGFVWRAGKLRVYHVSCAKQSCSCGEPNKPGLVSLTAGGCPLRKHRTPDLESPMVHTAPTASHQPSADPLQFLRDRVKQRHAPPATWRGTIDRVVVINLDRRADRMESFNQRVLAIADWPFPHPLRLAATDGHAMPADRWKMPDWWNEGSGAYACWLSHLRALEDARHAQADAVLILEDDAVFVEDFTAAARTFLDALPDDWDVAYLGGQHLKPPKQINAHVRRGVNINRGHAYAVRGRFVPTLIAHLTDWPAVEARHRAKPDEAKRKSKGWGQLDHWYGILHERQSAKVYAPTRWLVGQDAGKSNICGQDLATRFWQPGQPDPPPPVQQRQYLVLGHPRSGTRYMAKLMQALGRQVWHEHMGPDGISSWMMAVNADRVPFGDGSIRRRFTFDTIIHVVRHPLAVLASSMQTEAKRSLAFRRRWCKPPAYYNAHEEAVHILLAWDQFILRQHPACTVQAETADVDLPAALGLSPVADLPPKAVNARKHEPLTWTELRKHLRPELAARLEAYAQRYHYDLENPDAMPETQAA